jgi:ABC-2 type transport system permease protein
MMLIWTIARKEFIHIRRDPRTLAFIIVMPIMMLLLWGYAVNFDLKNISLAVVDYDRTPASRDFLQTMTAGGYFLISDHYDSADDLDRVLDLRLARVGVVIPAGFQRDLERGETTSIQFLFDGSDGNMANIAYGYVNAFSNSYTLKRYRLRMTEAGLEPPKILPNIQVKNRYWYNPELKSDYFIVSGSIAIIMMMIGAVITSLTLVNEKESGTIEQLIVSPIKPYQIILGKVLPFVFLSFVALILVLTAAYWVFGLPLRGSLVELLMLSLVYLIGVLGIGILVSSIVSDMSSAMILAMLLSMLPSVFLSGFVFPIRNMPLPLQWLTYIVPARYFLHILRGIYLKGIGVEILWTEVLFLMGFAVLVFGFAATRFRKRLD